MAIRPIPTASSKVKCVKLLIKVSNLLHGSSSGISCRSIGFLHFLLDDISSTKTDDQFIINLLRLALM
jgi:hypothetical protein